MAFVIPTIFKAFDQYSSVVLGMSRVTDRFTGKLQKAASQLVAYGEAALLIDGVLKTGNGIMEYQDEIQNLSAVTGATGAQLDKFKSQIESVAHETKKSAVEVAKAFTNVDNNMPQYHQNVAALGEVTKETIILAKAGRMELGPAAESLTMSMNQFGHAAWQAAGDVDALASGAVAGSSRIAETSEALQVFGTVAENVAKITYAESVALVELGSKFEKGSEAGTRFRNILLQMTNIKNTSFADEIGAAGVNMEIVSDRTATLSKRLHEISKIKDNPLLMEKLFEKRNVAMASGLFSLVDQYDKILAVTSKTGVAQEMAAKNTDTLRESVNQLGAAWITEIATSTQAGIGLNILSGIMHFTTDHMNGLVNALLLVGEGFLVFKTIQGSLYTYRFAVGMATFYTRGLAAANVSTAASMKGVATAAMLEEVALVPLIGTMGLAAGALMVIGHEMDRDAKIADILNNKLEKTKEGFEKLNKPLTQAQLELNEYMKEYAEHFKQIEYKRAEKIVDEQDNKKFRFRGFDFIEQAYEGIKDWVMHSPVDLPNINTFEHLTPGAVDSAIHEVQPVNDTTTTHNNNTENNQETSMNFIINVDRDGKGSIKKPSNYNGAINVKTGNTGPNYSMS